MGGGSKKATALQKPHIKYLIEPIQALFEWVTLILSIGAYIIANNGKKDISNLLLITWTQICILLPYIRWICQNWMVKHIKVNIIYLAKMNYLCNLGRIPHGGEIAATSKESYIPIEIQTEHPDARSILQACQENPYIWTISTTFQDWSKLKFAWLKIHKDSIDSLEKHLIPGDIILYHNKKSILGKLIRFFTKNYWEHVVVYIGDGEVMDIAPGGSRRVSLKIWTTDQNVELAIVRNDNMTIDIILKSEGKGYNYLGVIKEFFLIINEQKEAFLTTITLVTTTAIITSLLFLFHFKFNYIRLNIIYSFFACLFLIHQSRSRVAYLFTKLKDQEGSNEKP